MPNPRRDRWYGLKGQSRNRAAAFDRSSGTRRFASLVVLLVLVLVLIRLTSDTKRVETAATAIGLIPPQGQVPEEALNIQSPNRDPSQLGAVSSSTEHELAAFESLMLDTSSPLTNTYIDIWSSLLERAPTSLTLALGRKVFSEPDSLAVLTSAKADSIQDELENWYVDTQTRLLHWTSLESQNAPRRTVAPQPSPPTTSS
ncbi:MAG: hypothetical protein ABL921_32610, partial [Pirellula sp.]